MLPPQPNPCLPCPQVHDLKAYLTSHGVDMSGPDVPLEKEDLVDLAKGHHLKHSLGHEHPQSPRAGAGASS